MLGEFPIGESARIVLARWKDREGTNVFSLDMIPPRFPRVYRSLELPLTYNSHERKIYDNDNNPVADILTEGNGDQIGQLIVFLINNSLA